MNDIKELIRKVFDEIEYKIKDFSFVDTNDKLLNESLFIQNTNKKTYYLILFLEDEKLLHNLVKNQSRYFYLLKEFFGEDPNIEKNTSILILINSKNVSEKIIFNIEENPYYFRKYILQYSDAEFNEMKNVYSEKISTTGILKVFNEIISDVNLFANFKINPDSEKVYSFVSRIFIKLSVLGLNVENKQVNSLRAMIDDALEKKKLYIKKQKIDEIKFKYKKTNDDISEEYQINDELLEELINLVEYKE
ncbi:ABC-three component system middle component 1 [Solibacillus merdavium]|uniref:Uncharacterized protein n=1 Tax=Solibacillus merdavium TaxID=2762218 RepID=A0ABR8XSX5_9BACL|nr:ABC-three component system middle component 1 [Solibacillus merdavium]MBD8035045.1 hypothetical protein [Solibacillus merdavium]